MKDKLTEIAHNNEAPQLLHLDELFQRADQTVTFTGRCEAIRQLGGLTFLRVGGRYFSLQVIVLDPNLREATIEIRQGDIVSVSGLLRARPDVREHSAAPRADSNHYELVLQQFSILLQSQQIDRLTPTDAKIRQLHRHRHHLDCQLISLIRLQLEKQGFVQIQAPSSLDFHEKQRVREFIALSTCCVSRSPLFSAYIAEQLMYGTPRFYFFIEGAGSLPDLLQIVIARHTTCLGSGEELLAAIAGQIVDLLAPEVPWERGEVEANWQALLLHTQPPIRITAAYAGHDHPQHAAPRNDARVIAIRRRLKGVQHSSNDIAVTLSLPLGSLKAALEANKTPVRGKPSAYNAPSGSDSEHADSYEAYAQLESEHQSLLVEQSLQVFNSFQDIAPARCSSQAALRYIEPALHHYGMDSATVQRFLSLQAQLTPDASSTVCPTGLFQLLWTVLGNPSAKLLLENDTRLDRLLHTFVHRRILTDIRQIVFIHPCALDAMEFLLEHLRDRDSLDGLCAILRHIIAKTPTELATLLTTLASLEPASVNAAIAQVKKLESIAELGLTTPYWMSLCLVNDDLAPIVDKLRLSNLHASQRILVNHPVLPAPVEYGSGAGNHPDLSLAETLYTLFRPTTAGLSELAGSLSQLQDHCAHVENAGLKAFNLGFVAHLKGYRYVIHRQGKNYDHLRIYLSKNAASFFAKSTTGICTDINRELFERPDHFHLNLFSERSGRLIGNVQLYTLPIRQQRALLIRGINPIKSHATPCLVDEILDCIVACATDLAIENEFSMVCVAPQNGLWNSNSNRPQMRAALARRLVHQELLALDNSFHLYTYYDTPIHISCVYPLWCHAGVSKRRR